MTTLSRPTLTPLPERTKSRLLELVKRHGTVTAGELAQSLDISHSAARRHLSDLLAQGLLETRTERPSGRGRPQQVYGLSEQGEAAFPKTYASLCLDVLRQVAQLFGQEAVKRIFDGRNQELGERLEAVMLPTLPPEARLELMVNLLSELGFDAVLESDGQSTFLIQRNCPYLAIAQQFRALCQSEQELYERLLGLPLVRDKTIACGQGTCRYVLLAVPLNQPPGPTPPSPDSFNPGPHNSGHQS